MKLRKELKHTMKGLTIIGKDLLNIVKELKIILRKTPRRIDKH
jgi:hypothetical protein